MERRLASVHHRNVRHRLSLCIPECRIQRSDVKSWSCAFAVKFEFASSRRQSAGRNRLQFCLSFAKETREGVDVCSPTYREIRMELVGKCGLDVKQGQCGKCGESPKGTVIRPPHHRAKWSCHPHPYRQLIKRGHT